MSEAGEILLAHKPLFWSSFEVVNFFKHQVKPLKIGHAGTLDPLASGLLVLCTGKMTKQIESIQVLPKKYEGSMQLGFVTASYDRETQATPTGSAAHIADELIEQARLKFLGTIQQTPPVFSAVKVDGKRSYELGREGLSPELKSKEVTIYDFELKREGPDLLHFKVTCSKGTYIRSLVFDMGQALGCGAYMSRLVRTQIGDYKLSDAKTDLLEKTTAKSRILAEKVALLYP
jgi:tRNA pseudouridine55 synthase